MAAFNKDLSPSDSGLDTNNSDMRAHAIRGSAWMTVLRWVVRLLGIASTAILARLLTPADFGIYAMAMLALAVIEVFQDTGQDLALIRLVRPSREYLDSAWTMNVIIGVVLCACTLAAAPLAERYFHSHLVAVLVSIISVRPLLHGFINIGIVLFRVDLNFAKDFRYGVYRKLSVVLIGISCVLITRSYWGLIYTVILAKVVDIVLSYTMHPFRPRFRLAKVREIWSFSSWMLIVFLGEYFVRKADEYVVGATNSAEIMGAYTVGADLAVAPTIDLTQPVMRAVFPVYSRLLGDHERLRAAVLLVIGATATVCLATGLGVAEIAREFTLLLLGQQWKQAVPFVFWLGIGAIPVGMNYCLYTILSVTNNARLTAITVWARFVVLIPSLIVAGHWGGASAIAATQAAIGLLVLCADFFMLRLAVRVGFVDIISSLYRPAAAASAMVVALYMLDRAVQLPLVESMFLKIACGGIAYLAALTVAWLLAGRPDGVEAAGFALAARFIRSCGRWWR